jgi:acyl-CoA thioesterase
MESVERHPCPLPARAWWDGRLVAESTSAVRVDAADRPPVLHFPLAHVDRELLAQLASPPPQVPPLRGHLAFDTEADAERMRVELVDAVGSDSPQDVTVKRFPTWGDAADMVTQLDVRSDGPRRYVGEPRADWRRPVVEGSQILGQALVAAGRHAPGRRAVSAHLVFVRPLDARVPLCLSLDELSAGRTFTALGVRASQGSRVGAAGTLLLDALAPDVVRHGAPLPSGVPGPYDSEPCDMAVTGRDIRIVDGAYTGDSAAPVGPPRLDAWVRFRDLPDDPYIHAGLLAQFTGHLSIAAALRPHEGVGQDAAHRTISTAINAIGLSIHADVRADRWMLYRHRSTFAGDGMTHSECRVHDQDGDLLASFTVDAMVRPFTGVLAGGGAAVDERTAL